MEKNLVDLLPILGVEHDLILSKQGDITIGYEVSLPEIFTLSNQEYEAFHQAWVKGIKILNRQSVFHKQDWFTESNTMQISPNKIPASFAAVASAFLMNVRTSTTVATFS